MSTEKATKLPFAFHPFEAFDWMIFAGCNDEPDPMICKTMWVLDGKKRHVQIIIDQGWNDDGKFRIGVYTDASKKELRSYRGFSKEDIGSTMQEAIDYVQENFSRENMSSTFFKDWYVESAE